jgi:hypothetical protein
MRDTIELDYQDINEAFQSGFKQGAEEAKTAERKRILDEVIKLEKDAEKLGLWIAQSYIIKIKEMLK